MKSAFKSSALFFVCDHVQVLSFREPVSERAFSPAREPGRGIGSAAPGFEEDSVIGCFRASSQHERTSPPLC
jgi:hypothetical protein